MRLKAHRCQWVCTVLTLQCLPWISHESINECCNCSLFHYVCIKFCMYNTDTPWTSEGWWKFTGTMILRYVYDHISATVFCTTCSNGCFTTWPLLCSSPCVWWCPWTLVSTPVMWSHWCSLAERLDLVDNCYWLTWPWNINFTYNINKMYLAHWWPIVQLC